MAYDDQPRHQNEKKGKYDKKKIDRYPRSQKRGLCFFLLDEVLLTEIDSLHLAFFFSALNVFDSIFVQLIQNK